MNKTGAKYERIAPLALLNPPAKQYSNKIKSAQFAEIEWDDGCEYGTGNEVTTSNPLLIASITDRTDQNNDNTNTPEKNNTTTQNIKEDTNNNSNTTDQNDNNSNYIGITYNFSLS